MNAKDYWQPPKSGWTKAKKSASKESLNDREGVEINIDKGDSELSVKLNKDAIGETA